MDMQDLIEKEQQKQNEIDAHEEKQKRKKLNAKPSTPNGVIVYRGPSMLDGAPIVAVLTGIHKPSHNPKTGPMVQLWVVREDIAPHIAVTTGQDGAVCPEDCAQRQNRSCYVSTFQGPRSVWESYHRGNYPLATLSETKQIAALHSVRLAAYGDVAALPAEYSLALCGNKRTGYTHAWRQLPLMRDYVMASADSLDDAREAQALGWRTFRVMKPGDTLQPNEILCPSESKGVTCFDCQLCQGSSKHAKNIAIMVHGARKGRFTGRKLEVLA
jgi:hypothetical protein